MEQLNSNPSQMTSDTVQNITVHESDKNCFLREDCLIDFNSLINGFNSVRTKIGRTEETSYSPDTSETESATEEVEEIDLKLVGDDVIILETDEDFKQAYPNMNIFDGTQSMRHSFTVLNDDLNNDIKHHTQLQESFQTQDLTQAYTFETGVKSGKTSLNSQDNSENTLESSYYYIDSFPLTKNPPDVTDESNYDENNLEGVYTVGGGESTQSVGSGEMIEIHKEDPDEIENSSRGNNADNVIIISMKKFFIDKSKNPAKLQSNQVITSPLPTHKWKRLYECPQCAKKFSHGVNLSIHMEVHTNELHPHKCTHCGVSFAKSSQLARHLKKHNTTGTKKGLDCIICKANYKTYGHLRHHLITVHGVTVNRPLIQNFKTSNSETQILILKPKNSSNKIIDLHYSDEFAEDDASSTHRLASPVGKGISKHFLKCPVCNKAYKSRGSFRKHVNNHMGKECAVKEECEQKFESDETKFVGDLSEKQNIEIVSSEREFNSCGPRFKCSACSSCFGDFLTMIKHKNTSHRLYSFQKKICKARFSHKYLLQKCLIRGSHYNSRMRKQYKCRVCGAFFVSKVNCKLRDKADFLFGKPYRCAKCFSKLITRSNLKRHLNNEDREIVECVKNEETSKPSGDVDIKQEVDFD